MTGSRWKMRFQLRALCHFRSFIVQEVAMSVVSALLVCQYRMTHVCMHHYRHSAVGLYAMTTCLSVCLSVCPSQAGGIYCIDY